MKRIKCFSLYIQITFSITFFLSIFLTSSPTYSNLLPKLSLKSSGLFYGGKYTGYSERYNIDAGIDLTTYLLSWEKTDLYIEYISNLEMAKQVGNVTMDPRYAHYFIIGGLRTKLKGYILRSYIVHDCKHIIDFPPDSNKVVFNRLKFAVSRNLRNLKSRFQVNTRKNKRARRVSWEAIYGFYPQSKIIDYLNSRPYYKHDFEITFNYPLAFFNKGEISTVVRGRYTISANTPPRYYRELSFAIEGCIFNKYGALCLFIKNMPLSNDPLKSPEGLSILGLRYLF